VRPDGGVTVAAKARQDFEVADAQNLRGIAELSFADTCQIVAPNKFR
jgi:hypothetical protein